MFSTPQKTKKINAAGHHWFICCENKTGLVWKKNLYEPVIKEDYNNAGEKIYESKWKKNVGTNVWQAEYKAEIDLLKRLVESRRNSPGGAFTNLNIGAVLLTSLAVLAPARFSIMAPAIRLVRDRLAAIL